jgi:hypothetical protein
MNENLVVSDSKELNRCLENETNLKKEAFVREINDKKLMIDQILNWVDKRLGDFNPEKCGRDAPLENKFEELCHFTKEIAKKYVTFSLIQ